MLSLDKLAGTVAVFVIISYASGHREWVWRPLTALRTHVVKEMRKPWGCPSIFNKDACTKPHWDTEIRKKYPTVHDIIYSSSK